MSAAAKISGGRGPLEFCVKLTDGSFFDQRDWEKVRGRRRGGVPQWSGVKVFALQRFLAGAPREMTAWLMEAGTGWSVGVVGVVGLESDERDDCPRDLWHHRMALCFSDPATAILFKLTFGGAA